MVFTAFSKGFHEASSRLRHRPHLVRLNSLICWPEVTSAILGFAFQKPPTKKIKQLRYFSKAQNKKSSYKQNKVDHFLLNVSQTPRSTS